MAGGIASGFGLRPATIEAESPILSPRPLFQTTMPRSFPVDRASTDVAASGCCACSNSEQQAEEPAARLVSLDQRKVAVQLNIQGREELIVGVGDYDVDPDLGGVLRVQTSNRKDAPELMFVEGLWNGTIRRGHALGCDFLIHLG
jgi:hypothetical protein